ncbi:MAG: leucine-rich repeat protein [Bacteroidales bacterium]|nr:leucine-rich repeat protein [Bacteroidales bacterium]
MKKIFKYFASAIVLAGFVFVSCSKDDLTPATPEEDGVKYTLTVTASREKTPDTKLLELGGASNKTLYKKWALNDEVSVYKGETLAGTLRATSVSSDGFDATLTGQLTGTTIATGDDLVMKFRTPDYSAQDGTLACIASTCDYAEAEVTVASVDGSGNITTTEDALFKNQQAIVKFTLQDEAANLLSATRLTVKVKGMSDIVVTPSTATSELFVAVPGIEEKDINLYAVVGGNSFRCKKSAATLENSKYYGIKASMFNSLCTPLTVAAKSSGTITFFLMNNTDIQPITYRLNNGSPITISTGSTATIDVSAGDRVAFYGNNSFYGTNSSSSSSKISGTADYYVYGNIMSLIDADNFATLETINHDYTFAYMFNGNTHIYSHDWKRLTLPAKNVYRWSYSHMFNGCTNLIQAPDLPATTLAQGCYEYMFEGCSKLLQIPYTLPATDLAADNASACYMAMFRNCPKIINAPSLPSTTVITNCYFSMFEGCTGLTNIPSTLPGALDFCCYKWMFKGCTNIVTAPSFTATSYTSTGDMESCYGMFSGCTKLKTANISFDLGTEGTLTERCCYEMFLDCKALTTGPTVINAAEIARGGCGSMFSGCENLTTFPTNLPAMTVKASGYYRMFLNCKKMTTAPTLPATNLAGSSYEGMFMNCTALTTVQSNLPAPKLYTYTYDGMFSGCKNLQTAPSLSFTELEGTYNCWSMFSGCTSLVNVPDLPLVAELTDRCYQFMFSSCSNLENAPLLPNATLKSGSYLSMFSGCTKLKYVKCLATDLTASDCTKNWMNGVAAMGTFVKASSATWGTGVNGIPEGWTVEDAS